MSTMNLHKIATNHLHVPGISPEHLTSTFCSERYFVFSVDETCGCNTIEIVASSPASIPSSQAGIYTTYTIEPDLVNFRSHYTSQDGNKVIAFNMDHNEWKIQPLANR